ncbi:MAG: FAD-binding oxidoreductase, partial [Thermoguttaceae bacterium]
MLEEAIHRFATRYPGRVIQRADEEYDSARRVYNAMIDKRPRLIVRCEGVEDVREAVTFAGDQGLPLAVRGAGHNGAGLGTCDDGLVLDLCRMKALDVDPQARTVRAQGGCTQGEIDRAAHPFGLTVPAGIISTTGIGGLALGGGHGYLTRKFGLTIDHLLAADLVLADGRSVTASPEEHPDLFWAIRGGGGNFGVVTSFLFRARPVNTVVAGPMLWDMDFARHLMQWYREYMPSAPEDMYGFLAILSVPPGPPFPPPLHGRIMCGIVWCYTGPPDDAPAAFRPVRQLREPVFEHLGPMPFPTLQSLFDPLMPAGMQWYWKGDFVVHLSDEAIEQHIEYGLKLPTPLSTMHLYPIDGAVRRAARSDTAFNHRDANWSMVIAGIDPDPANAEAITTWAKDYWAAVHPYSAQGAYVNFMMEEGADRVRATYGDNYDRLVGVKTKYDPRNIFHV